MDLYYLLIGGLPLLFLDILSVLNLSLIVFMLFTFLIIDGDCREKELRINKNEKKVKIEKKRK